MLKDYQLSQIAAQAADADTPMGQTALDLSAQFVEHEVGLGKNFSAMLPLLEKHTCSRLSVSNQTSAGGLSKSQDFEIYYSAATFRAFNICLR